MSSDTLVNIALALGMAAVAWLCRELLVVRREKRRLRREAERYWAEQRARREERRAAWE